MIFLNPEEDAAGTWSYLIYFVAAPRRDGTAPSMNKACEDKIFFTFKDADEYREKISKEVGYEYKVFYAYTLTPRMPPVTKEIYE